MLYIIALPDLSCPTYRTKLRSRKAPKRGLLTKKRRRITVCKEATIPKESAKATGDPSSEAIKL